MNNYILGFFFVYFLVPPRKERISIIWGKLGSSSIKDNVYHLFDSLVLEIFQTGSSMFMALTFQKRFI